MKNMDKITLKDIRKAIKLIKENMPPDKIIETEFGFMKIDGLGNCVELTLKKGVYELLQSYLKQASKYQNVDIEGEISTFEGIPIIRTKHIDDLKGGKNEIN